jgi:hypothetical protein
MTTTPRSSLTNIVDAPDLSATSTTNSDPLLVLLQRYDLELAAFNAQSGNEFTQQDWDRIAESSWSRTQDEILKSKPTATTALGALLALDHVLNNEDIFFAERTECADQQMMWLLVKAARDYIATTAVEKGP